MKPGTVLDERFEIEREIGFGGMGTVYRALDRRTSAPVAVKLLRIGAADDRFAREIATLAELSHPRIVRYIESGTAPDGARYLAMEWLEGEDLAARLLRAPITITESLELIRHVSEALAAAHRRGIIHRDIKPSNLFLPGNDLTAVKLLDFGIARRTRDRAMTRTGAVLGTPEYMAPEQARGDRTLDARVDVFALGCVLFECIAGYPPFAGDSVMAVLAKILLDEPPRLSEVRSGVASDLDTLVAAMLSKDPNARPADASAVIAACGQAALAVGKAGDVAPSAAPSLTHAEQRVVCVVLAAAVSRESAATEIAETLVADALPAAGPDLEFAAYGARVAPLADGSVLALIAGDGTAVDHATRAAHCALAMRTRYATARIVVATGRGLVTSRVPIGDVIDRATRALHGAVSGGPVRLDEATAGLVDARFELGGDSHGLFLVATRAATEQPRTLLGKPTKCVGRDRELLTLQGILEECIAEPGARAALVVGAAGVGKSRLLHEFLVRTAKREQPASVLIARGDPVRAGAPFGTIAPAIRRAAGILDREPAEIQRARLRAHMARHFDAAALANVTEFLGELAGIAAADIPPGERLRAARNSAAIMTDAMQLAWLDWLQAEAAQAPLVIVLEDLQWADLPSVRLVDAALRVLQDRPLAVVALAREEFRTRFPNLWNGHNLQELQLGLLSRKAAEKLTREVLGESATADVVARIVERCDGNAFFLEETIRAVAAGTPVDVLPDSVLGVLQTRLGELSPEARRTLRAASVFGQSFDRGGVEHLIGVALRSSAVSDAIDDLVARELVSPRTAGPRTDEHSFRNALVRDAAYAMLADDDRVLGHRLAAEWLESTGESNAILLAEHYDKGGDPLRSVQCYLRGAEQTFQSGDPAMAMAQAQRGIDLGATGFDKGRFMSVQVRVHAARGENKQALALAEEAIGLLQSGSVEYFKVVQTAATSAANVGLGTAIASWADRLIRADPMPDAAGEKLRALLLSGILQIQAGMHDSAAFRRAVEAIVTSSPNLDADARASIAMLRAGPVFASADLSSAERAATESIVLYEAAGAFRSATEIRGVRGFLLAEIGRFEEAEAILRQNVIDAGRLGAPPRRALAMHNLGYVLAAVGRLDEAHRVEQEAVDAFKAQGNARLEGGARVHLARILILSGDTLAAEREARAALAVVPSGILPRAHSDAQTMLAWTLRLLGRFDEALACCTAAAAFAQGGRGGRTIHPLVHAETLADAGRMDEARVRLREAVEIVEATALGLAEPRDRASYRERTPDCVRALALAAAWGP